MQPIETHSNHTQDELALLQLMEQIIDAFNKMDVDKLLSLHTDSIILMEPNMPAIEGKEKIRKAFHKLATREILMQLASKVYEVEATGNRGFLRGQIIKTTIVNGIAESETGKFICLFQKQTDGRWLRTHVIVNTDAEVSWATQLN